MRNLIYITITILLLSSCRSSRVSETNTLPVVKHSNGDVANYVGKYASIAVSEMRRTGVPASITLAQGIIESNYGNSRLARLANNHFGVKCHSDWRGKKIYHDDDRRNECFRSYPRVEESFIDHSDFLRNGSRYSFLFDLSTDDYRAWARGLKKAGYATNPKYDNMIIKMIEENMLSVYDKSGSARRGERPGDNIEPVERGRDESVELQQIGNNEGILLASANNRIKLNNRIQYIIVDKEDTYETIAKDYELLSWEIFRYNDLEDGMSLYPGQLIYLQPKRMKAEAGKDFHIFVEGESMYSISQLYGIKLRTLYDRNGIEFGTEPKIGEELWLRKTRPEDIR